MVQLQTGVEKATLFVVPEALLIGDLRINIVWFNYKQVSMRSRPKSITGMTVVSEHYRDDSYY
ncbi:hypothetical protein GCM10009114_34360 [Aliiglaciecola litoralis]|uniref:Uncharacterized protein n=1 Tax=Aliiglaciecola litoralis TaxID=582857 RepID=A0ABN1LT11_9ALTE